jgi:hypothetical protein
MTSPHIKKSEIDQLRKRIDEQCQLQGKEFFNNV